MQRVHPLVTLILQIAKTVQNEKLEIRLFGNGLVVLGLATSHCRKITWKRGRYVDERPHRYHRRLMSVFVSAGLISAPGTPCLT